MDAQKSKTRVAALSVFSNTTLVVLKLVVGLMIGSVSVISEAIHSGLDLMAAVIAYMAVRVSGKSADETHRYGHGKFENISGTIEALLIFVAALWIIWEAGKKFMHPEEIGAAAWGIWVMLFGSVVNIIVSEMLFRVARKTDSVALKADAWHLRTDVYTSLSVFLGLSVIWLGRRFQPEHDLRWIDPTAAIVVALLILHAAWKLLLDAARDLLDVSLPADEEEWLTSYLEAATLEVGGYHKLRTRKAGATRFVDLHLLVCPTMTVQISHDLTEEIARGITQRFPGSNVTVHVEPCTDDENARENCNGHCEVEGVDSRRAGKG